MSLDLVRRDSDAFAMYIHNSLPALQAFIKGRKIEASALRRRHPMGPMIAVDGRLSCCRVYEKLESVGLQNVVVVK